jgi:hypothetical protein
LRLSVTAAAKAFSSEVVPGSRKKNASKTKSWSLRFEAPGALTLSGIGALSAFDG